MIDGETLAHVSVELRLQAVRVIDGLSCTLTFYCVPSGL